MCQECPSLFLINVDPNLFRKNVFTSNLRIIIVPKLFLQNLLQSPRYLKSTLNGIYLWVKESISQMENLFPYFPDIEKACKSLLGQTGSG